MKYELRRIARENILMSWLESSSSAPIPSESTMSTLIGFPSAVVPGIGFPHSHKPYITSLNSSAKLFPQLWVSEIEKDSLPLCMDWWWVQLQIQFNGSRASCWVDMTFQYGTCLLQRWYQLEIWYWPASPSLLLLVGILYIKHIRMQSDWVERRVDVWGGLWMNQILLFVSGSNTMKGSASSLN